MKTIERLLTAIERFFYRLEMRRIERYLSQAQNAADLEQRIRALESHPGFYLP